MTQESPSSYCKYILTTQKNEALQHYLHNVLLYFYHFHNNACNHRKYSQLAIPSTKYCNMEKTPEAMPTTKQHRRRWPIIAATAKSSPPTLKPSKLIVTCLASSNTSNATWWHVLVTESNCRLTSKDIFLRFCHQFIVMPWNRVKLRLEPQGSHKQVSFMICLRRG